MLRTAIAGAVALILATDPTWSQSNPQFIAFQGISKGALYSPIPVRRPMSAFW